MKMNENFGNYEIIKFSTYKVYWELKKIYNQIFELMLTSKKIKFLIPVLENGLEKIINDVSIREYDNEFDEVVEKIKTLTMHKAKIEGLYTALKMLKEAYEEALKSFNIIITSYPKEQKQKEEEK
jgi:hypothetical protein